MPNLSPDTVAQIIATIGIGIVAVVGSLIAARLGAREGARASLAATKAFAEEQEERQRAAVRLLLSLEIEANLARVQAFWSDIWSIALPEDIRNEEGPEWKRQSFSRRVWNGQTSVLGSAISAEEIRRTNRIYGQLDTLSGIQARLVEMDTEQARHTTTGIRRLGEEGALMAAVTFNEVAPSLWVETEEIVAGLLANGNPISEDAKGATVAAP
jgi:hypothetical protein